MIIIVPIAGIQYIGKVLFYPLFFPQMLKPGYEQHLAKEVVLSSWTMLAALEQSFCSLTAQTLELVYTTVNTLRMLEQYARVN